MKRCWHWWRNLPMWKCGLICGAVHVLLGLVGLGWLCYDLGQIPTREELSGLLAGGLPIIFVIGFGAGIYLTGSPDPKPKRWKSEPGAAILRLDDRPAEWGRQFEVIDDRRDAE